MKVSVIVPLQKHRKDFYNKFVRPSIEATNPFEIIELDYEGGACEKRNDGAKQAKGDYLYFCDDDCILSKDIFKKYEAIGDADFAYGDFMFIRMNGTTFTFHAKPFDVQELIRENYISTMSLVKKSSFIGFDPEIVKLQDWDMFLSMTEKGMRGVYIPDTLFLAFYLDNGISHGTITHEEAVKAIRSKHESSNLHPN